MDPTGRSRLTADPGEDGPWEWTGSMSYLPDGFRFAVGDLGAVALGGAGSIDRSNRLPGISWWDDERIATDVVDQVLAGAPADVMVCHDAPAGVDLDLNPGFARLFTRNDPEVLEWCEEHRRRLGAAADHLSPSVIVHGHHHRRFERRRPGPVREARDVCLDCDGTEFEDNFVLLADLL